MGSPLLFNLYIRHLPNPILHCDLFQYADDSSLLKVISSNDDRTAVADELNADLDSHGVKLGTLILNLLSAAHSVSHSKEILIYTLHCLWLLSPLMRLMC